MASHPQGDAGGAACVKDVLSRVRAHYARARVGLAHRLRCYRVFARGRPWGRVAETLTIER